MTVVAEEMHPLTDCTSLLDDHAALDRILDERGHWFFRDVLDQHAIAEARAVFLAELERRQLIEPGDENAVWNGRDVSDLPVKIETLHVTRHWRRFVSHPAIHSFFTDLLGAPPFWVPSVEYRIVPPLKEAPADLLTGPHQDGFANRGTDLLACWIPLSEIDAQVGGLAMAAGLHKCGFFHDINDAPLFRVPQGAIPDDAWCRSDYMPGDLVVFGIMTPHSGLVNLSNRFRLSLDIRVMPISGKLPLVGELLEISADHVVIANHDGRDVRLVLDDETYCRCQSGARIPRERMIELMKVGDPVLAPYEGERAILFRPQR